ncbi:hypothetical protein VL20_657 [Microcystis panniformis FACHB-1757]|uniref:Uncharacterized protein n=1 Tax=Microcystis panniformis FACHB-1757 TaxID=1638788 RepID=A0A0K1RVD6_9CHRO|nr:hypothetical protein VL20_657 [Microcystis panniformis FACHB-1757]
MVKSRDCIFSYQLSVISYQLSDLSFKWTVLSSSCRFLFTDY